jgi:hypothetical protein
MNRSDVTELYYITRITNVPSILKQGVLSNRLSSKLPHDSIAMPEMQDKRENKRIPGAGMLHDYANLYFDAHNPMLSKRRDRNNEICVLRISAMVLGLPGAIISDKNAASDYVHFYPAKDGLVALDKDTIFAPFWLHPENPVAEWRHKSAKCAEVLVPNKIDPKYILGAIVANQTALESLRKIGSKLPIEIKGDIFF